MFLLAVGFTTAQGQSGRAEYLRDVGRDMRSAGFFRGADSARIIGFGTLPGRAGTEEAELALISDILNRTDTLYYFIETDYATAYRFNRYLATGDGALLRELVSDYGRRVPLERSVEVYRKWERLREISEGKTFRVYGIDQMACYRSTFLLLLYMVRDPNWIFRERFESARWPQTGATMRSPRK